jgi:hypothetical protein
MHASARISSPRHSVSRATLVPPHRHSPRPTEPDKALELQLQHYAEFVATKHWPAVNLHSGDPAFSTLPAYSNQHFKPVLRRLPDEAENASSIGGGMNPTDLIGTLANSCIAPPGTTIPPNAPHGPATARRFAIPHSRPEVRRRAMAVRLMTVTILRTLANSASFRRV